MCEVDDSGMDDWIYERMGHGVEQYESPRMEREDILPKKYPRTLDGLKQLIGEREDIFAVDRFNNNLAHVLLSEVHEDTDTLKDCVEYLISLPEGPQLFKMKNKSNATPLLVWFGFSLPAPEQVEKIVKITGEDINALDVHGNTMFLRAAEKGNSLECLKCLKTNGADHNVYNKSGNNALHFSAYNGDLESVRYLASIDVSVEHQNDHGNTPILIAALWKQYAVIKYLLSQGAGIVAVNRDGNNLGHMLFKKTCNDIPALENFFEYLTSMRQGRELFKMKNKEGKTPLQVWMESENSDCNIKTIEMLIKNSGIDLNPTLEAPSGCIVG